MHNKKFTSTVLKRHSRGILPQAKGGCSDQVHSDQMVLGIVRQEAAPQERQPKVLQTKLTKGGSPGSRPGGRLELMRGGQRCSRENWKTTLQ
jgi:hypothetical protein